MHRKTIVSLFLVLMLTACGAQKAAVTTETIVPDRNTAAQETSGCPEQTSPAVLTEVPPLTLKADDVTLQVRAGSASWFWENGDGTRTGYEADGVHPLESPDYLENLGVTGTSAALDFGSPAPDLITIRCWSTACWGDYDALYTELPVEAGVFHLQPGGYVYEIFAQWSSTESYGGSGYYAFYAETS